VGTIRTRRGRAPINLTPEQVEILRQTENAAHLRDLYHTIGWRIYCDLAKARIDRLNHEYLYENFDQPQAWEARVKLQAIMQFQALMEEIVRNAVDLVDPAAIERMILENMYKQEVENG
jgi:hypothetical protein